jgi:predicted nicotinamide N-methyase
MSRTRQRLACACARLISASSSCLLHPSPPDQSEGGARRSGADAAPPSQTRLAADRATTERANAQTASLHHARYSSAAPDGQRDGSQALRREGTGAAAAHTHLHTHTHTHTRTHTRTHTLSSSRPSSMSDAHRAALLSHALPRRSHLPNRLEPFDCKFAWTAVQQSVSRWCAARTHAARAEGAAASTGPVARQVAVGTEPVTKVTIYETHGDYATRLWFSSMRLAEWLARNATSFEGRSVLEVGAGTGLCALVLAARCASVPVAVRAIVASDVSERGLKLLGAAARAQGLGVQCVALDICREEEALPASVDWLVASDVLYTPQLARALACRCIEIVRRGGSAVVADPGRPTRRLFQSILEREGLRSEFVPLSATTPSRRDCPGATGEKHWAGTGALVLLHVDDEHSVSDFAAHADLEG